MTTPNKTPPGADPKQLERTGTVREIGSQAVWSLSSCKPGFGVDQLRDDNLETYWQSDGSQPHLVNIQFRRKTTVKTLCIYADYKSDESYTPSKISVRVGNNFHNLQEIRQLELVEPSGWIHVPLTDNHKKPTRTFMIQIAVLANHQNGRDTHMRQIKIYTPVEESSIGKFPRCTTIDFMMYRSISPNNASRKFDLYLPSGKQLTNFEQIGMTSKATVEKRRLGHKPKPSNPLSKKLPQSEPDHVIRKQLLPLPVPDPQQSCRDSH
ncbi:hypothetical protein MG293_013438 [Ovis ammon polii]|uniref:Anaphase-promoting complex subunit 10 n=1 Tax=Ovis ammon polii TaxID=230172 RepID=A0AAD4TZ40_OVIAM|nr:hypothetical protein MG293_013438 [Ovis ammon polii]KAI4557164.1 hypothetical protein MJT46_013843 [Ovis ammon polii x Ovis aries]